MKSFSLFILCLLSFLFTNAQTNFILSGDTWKYLDNGTDQGTAWRAVAFNDAAWSSGASQLGYGDGDEATVVSFGPSSTNRYPTTYFRKTITIPNPVSFQDFTIRLKRDDGAVVYVNGVEVFRDYMPTGAPVYSDYSSGTASDDGATWLTVLVNKSKFVAGTNTIAVEIHNASATSSDISFDLELIGNPDLVAETTLDRGPYLQVATPTGITIRWRTSDSTLSKVKYGLSVSALNDSIVSATNTTEHIVLLTGLTADTKYYYAIGSADTIFQSGADNYFYTLPLVGTERKYSIWVTGDCGTGYTTQAQVRDSYVSYMGANRTDAWILLGDNAYNSGYDFEFQSKFFEQYPNQLKNMTLWPTPGNHDYYGSSTGEIGDAGMAYFSQFSLPTNAEAGGVASGTKAYYSYNIGNIHMISLDSYGEEAVGNKKFYDTTSAQALWLKADLAANTQKWTIVYFHHPPYTKGSHNSDTESDLVAIRSKLMRIIERYKVDLVLCGHSHSYERSKLMKGHYGLENTFSAATHHLSSSSAKYDGTSNSCPYVKNGAADGTVYVVSGSAGKFGGTSTGWPHNAMYYSDEARGGSMVLEIEENRLDAKWICDDGLIRDKFTIMKDVNQVTTYTITEGQSVNLTSSWVGQYNWSAAGQTTASISASPTSTATIFVNDQYNCLTDSFHVNVIPTIGLENLVESNTIKVYPNPSTGIFSIESAQVEAKQLKLVNELGQVVESFDLNKKNNFTKAFNVKAGNYFIIGESSKGKINKKIIVVQ